MANIVTADIRDHLADHALALGLFSQVLGYEPKGNVQGVQGMPLAAVWVQSVGPVPMNSGLATTSVRVEFTFRIYSQLGLSMSGPGDEKVDPSLSDAAAAFMFNLSGDFDLDGTVYAIDLLGMAGPALSAKAGYLNLSGTHYRIMDITVPVIISDVWPQAG